MDGLHVYESCIWENREKALTLNWKFSLKKHIVSRGKYFGIWFGHFCFNLSNACQFLINSVLIRHSRKINHSFYVNLPIKFLTSSETLIAEARAEINGPSEKYVRPGSTLQLHCLVKKSTEAPSFLFWYQNRRMINYDVEHGVNVSTDLSARESWLEIPRASDRHSGNYTCEASNATPAFVTVHIFNGDNPAAMQHSVASSPSVIAFSALLTLSTALKLVVQRIYVYAGS